MCNMSIEIKKNRNFNMRTCAFPIKGNKVLISKNDNSDYCLPIGGRIQYGEDSLTAIQRELEEELGVNIAKNRLKLKIIGEYTYSIGEKMAHEIIFIYCFDYTECKNFNKFKIHDKDTEFAIWVDLDDLKNLNIKPNFLRKFKPNQRFKHIMEDKDVD